LKDIADPKSGLTEPGEQPKPTKPVCRCPCSCDHRGECAWCLRKQKARDPNNGHGAADGFPGSGYYG